MNAGRLSIALFCMLVLSLVSGCENPASPQEVITYDAFVTLDEGTWTVTNGENTVYTGADMAAAIQAGIDSLTPGRTEKEGVLVSGSGDISANTRVALASYTILNVLGTINVTGTPAGADLAPIYARAKTDIDVLNLKITGTPQYAVFIREVDNVFLGQIDIRVTAGLGIRIDNNNLVDKVTNVQVDYLYVEGTADHGIETYGVDDLTIGRVDAVNTGGSAVQLNNTTNAEIGSIYGTDCATGTGYAVFRIANKSGKIASGWPSGNIHVGLVYARNGGRGIFSVSESGGLTIDRIDIANTGNNPILLQNCINTVIAAQSGTVSTGSVVLSNDPANTGQGLDYAPSANVSFKNIALSNGASITQSTCEFGNNNCTATNITGGTVTMCP